MSDFPQTHDRVRRFFSMVRSCHLRIVTLRVLRRAPDDELTTTSIMQHNTTQHQQLNTLCINAGLSQTSARYELTFVTKRPIDNSAQVHVSGRTSQVKRRRRMHRDIYCAKIYRSNVEYTTPFIVGLRDTPHSTIPATASLLANCPLSYYEFAPHQRLSGLLWGKHSHC